MQFAAMKSKSILQRASSLVLLAVALCGLGSTSANAISYELQGQSRNSTDWIPGNLQNWRELDYVPCRVYITGGPI